MEFTLDLQRPQPNVLRCTAEERTKGWSFDNKLTFSPKGMMAERNFISKGVKTTKYYEKMTSIEIEEKKRK